MGGIDSTPPASDHDYWEERARRFGARAVGYSDLAMDGYEDRLRRSAISRLLGQGQGRRLLDAGCGSGRWTVRLAEAGWVVTGADLSESLLALAPPARGVTYIGGAIQDLDLPTAGFDAFLSVTVLQHITDDRAFDAALDNLTRMLRPGGLAAILEYAPLVAGGQAVDYMRARSRAEWLAAFDSRGYTRRAEAGVRFLGHVPYLLAERLAQRLRPSGRTEAGAVLKVLRSACWAKDLALSRVPLLTLAADVRLIIFERGRTDVAGT